MTTPQPAPGTFCWFECGTRDAAAAKRFYTGVFGWEAVDMPMPGDAGTYTLLKLGGKDVAGLYQMAGPRFEGVPPHWLTYVCVENADETAARARSLGGKVALEPMDVPGVGRIAMIQDPTGANIALFKPGEHSGTIPMGMTPGTFGWSELATRDTKRAKAFYTELFDWNAKADTGGMPYTEWQVGGKSIGGMMEMTLQHGDAPTHWLPYVVVADCDASAKKVTDLGGKLIVPPKDIPKVGRFSVFFDPTGAGLAIIQLTGHV